VLAVDFQSGHYDRMADSFSGDLTIVLEDALIQQSSVVRFGA